MEAVREHAVRTLHPRPDVAAYILAQVACGTNALEAAVLMGDAPHAVHVRARDRFFGLQWGVHALGNALPAPVFERDVVDAMLSGDHATRGNTALEFLAAYAHLRDVFITYGWGGFELTSSSAHHLAFADSPDWPGYRDHAQTVLAQRLELEAIRRIADQLLPDTNPADYIRRLISLPLSFDLGGLPLEEFLGTWRRLVAWCAGDVWTGRCPIVSPMELRGVLAGGEDRRPDYRRRFLELLTFNPGRPSGLTLFHCPIVALAESALLVIPAAVLLGNVEVTVPRLLVHRGPGLASYAKSVERHLLERLRVQFTSERVLVRTERAYTAGADHGDVDLIAYETDTNRLVVVMTKAFIPPDSTEEVIRANEALEAAIGQVLRVERWLGGLPAESWAGALDLPIRERPELRLAVCGDGFAGSDYLPIPPHVTVVSARLLLASEWRNTSPIDALDVLAQRLAAEVRRAESPGRKVTRSFLVDDLRIDYPSFALEF